MARNIDELDEMLVPQDHSIEAEDEVKVGKPRKDGKPQKSGGKKGGSPTGDAKKTPRQLEKEAAKKKERIRTVLTVVLCFVVLLGAVIGTGVLMGGRVDFGSSDSVKKATPAPGRTFFTSNIEPELSAEGVKGRLKEVYYTKNGKLAVTVRLSNGMATEQKLVKLDIRIFKDGDITIAQKTLERFKPACVIPANGRVDYYFEIERKNVLVKDDSLSKLSTTMEIGSQDTGNDPKAFAPGRSYYENDGNLPQMSADGVQGSIVFARYTNDDSLALTLCFSNGTATRKQVTAADVLIKNAQGAVIAKHKIESFATPCKVNPQGYAECDVIIDSAYVSLKDDSLETLTYSIEISAAEAT